MGARPFTSKIVPQGEGVSRPLSLAIPKRMLERIDRVAQETKNTRAETVRHLIRAGIEGYLLREKELSKNPSR